MSALQKRFELRPHHVSQGVAVFFLLAAVGLLLAGELVFCAHMVILALLFSVAGRRRCGKLIPFFGLGLLIGFLLSPIAQHDDYNELQQIALFATGGIVGLSLGLFVELLDIFSRRSVIRTDFDKRIICDEQS